MEDNSNAITRDDVEFFTSLVRCETRLYNAVGQRLRSAHGLGAGQFELLRFIRDHVDARVADLAAEFAIGVGVTSKAVDRLEAEGWVVRRPNPANRRSSLLVLTDRGEQLVAVAEHTFAQEIARHLASALTPGEIASIAKALSSLQSILEDGHIGVPSG